MSHSESFTQTRRITIISITTCAATWLLACLAPALAAPHNDGGIPQAQAGRAADGGQVPEGLSTSDWSSIRAAYETRRHDAFAVDGGYQSRNPGQRWRTRFDGRGFLTTPDAGGWSWGLKLLSYGREGAAQSVTAPSRVEADGGRVSYPWDNTLTEWYVNDRRGLEHGYTIQRRQGCATGETPVPPLQLTPVPLTSGTSMLTTGETPVPPLQTAVPPLQLTLAVRGDLHPRVSAGGRGVTFVNDAGAVVVNYHGLSVVDAGGAALPAWFEASTEDQGDALVLRVDDRDAHYPLTIDPIAQQAYLKASNTNGVDQFGRSVAVSGDTVVVGAGGEDSSATGVDGNQADNSAFNSGAAYVFVRDAGGVWSQQAYLKASNTDWQDFFGDSVAVSGDTVVVGANHESSNATGVDGNQADNSATRAGAAYVFVRDAGGVWSQQAYLKASNTDFDDQFGVTVAVSGDTVVVGAWQEASNATGVDGNQADNSATRAGAAYVFVRSAGGVWSQQAYLKASNTDLGDSFGESVAISGDTVVVGADGEDSSATGVDGNQADNSATRAGAAYVFVRSASGVWSQQAYLKASNTDGGDGFGGSVAVSGDTVVVGAVGEASSATGVNGYQADNSASFAGAAYLFVRDAGGVWSQQAYLKASNTDGGDGFGGSVAVSADTVVVGALGEASSATGVDGNQSDNSAEGAGAAYVFVLSAGSVWSQQVYLKASNTDGGDFFGGSVAVSGNTVVVGAFLEDSNATGVNGNQADNSATDAGAAYVFRLLCGDGILDPGEACDDGVANSDTLPDACRTNCVLPRCGDGVVDTGEACDSGAVNSDTLADACRTTCVLPTCGDGVVDTGEMCDDAANSDTLADACRTNCVLPTCGDGVVDRGEACDDGAANSDSLPDACRTNCTLPTCGDGVVDTGEACDDGAANSDTLPDACRTSCALPTCGDGVVDTGEACDDGAANSDTLPDACRTNCVLPTCGDGVVDTGEACDDGNTIDGDGCNGICTVLAPPSAVDTTGSAGHGQRYLGIAAPGSIGHEVIRVMPLHTPGLTGGAGVLYLSAPFVAPDGTQTDASRTFIASQLVCEPVAADFGAFAGIAAYSPEILPSSKTSIAQYSVQRANATCPNLVTNPNCWSQPPLIISQGLFGDVATPFFAAPGDVEPDFNDINAYVAKFLGSDVTKPAAQLTRNLPRPTVSVNFMDISADVCAFLGSPYEECVPVTPCTCPSLVTCGATACAGDTECPGGLCLAGACVDACGRCTP